MKIRNEIIEILPDLEGVSEYIQANSYFKRSEVIDIILELNRFGSSSTLSEILQYQLTY